MAALTATAVKNRVAEEIVKLKQHTRLKMTNIALRCLSVLFVYILAAAFSYWSLETVVSDSEYKFWIPQILAGVITCGWIEYLRRKPTS